METESKTTIDDLGRKGLTWDWSMMELNKKYFVSRNNAISMNVLWLLSQGKITEQVQKLNAEVCMWEDYNENGWYLLLKALPDET